MKIKIPSGWSEKDLKLHQKTLSFLENKLNNPSFQNAVKNFRERHGIPKHGFSNIEKHDRWWREKEKEIIQVADVQELVTLDGEDKPKIQSQPLASRMMKTYELDLYKLLSDFKLSTEWHVWVDNFIRLNDSQYIKMSEYNMWLTRYRVGGIVVGETITFNIGATMKPDFLTDKFLGKNIWEDIRTLQRLMQGYEEVMSKPSKSKARLRRKIVNQFEKRTVVKRGPKSEGREFEFSRDQQISSMVAMPSNPATIRKHISRLKKANS